MFEWLFWPSIVNGIKELPKETIYVGVAAYVVLEIHRRNTNVKLAAENAKIRVAEAEVEALKLKLELK
jgi:hypothetical protein